MLEPREAGRCWSRGKRADAGAEKRGEGGWLLTAEGGWLASDGRGRTQRRCQTVDMVRVNLPFSKEFIGIFPSDSYRRSFGWNRLILV